MPLRFPRLNARQRADLYAQLATLEEAGLPYAQAAGLLSLPQIPRFAHTARHLQAQLNRGADLASAGERCGIFSGFDAALLRAALATGDLSRMYRRLAEHYAARARRAGLIKARLALPVALLVLSTFIQPLPDLVLSRIDGLAYARLTGWRLLQFGGAAYLLIRLPGWLREGFLRPLKPLADALHPRLPLFGPMHLRRNLRDFFTSLGLLLEAGVPMAESLAKALDTVDNRWLRAQLAPLPGLSARGCGLAEALRTLALPIRPEALSLITTGEASGRLPEMLLRHGAMEDEAIDSFDTQLADWLPRLIYAGVAAAMASAILGSGAFLPSAGRLP